MTEHKTRYRVRVRFGDTDLMGIVHHAVYLSYFEAGRVEHLRRRGIDAEGWGARGLHFPVVDAALRYRRPARFDQVLVVETWLAKLTRVTLEFAYHVRCAASDALLAEGSTRLACVDNDHRPVRVPADLASLILGPEVAPRPESDV
ncbi:MAG: thioesterase family protein [Polyangiaceae bacterium]